jgi:methionyl-tRNA formyltransferase
MSILSKSVIAYSRDWFKIYPKSDEFKKLELIEITNKNDLILENLERINPKYVFFAHWNWRVDPEIFETFECIVFHTAPLPYGRGGSPIQNLIIRGVNKAPVCALKMTDVLDGGPIYDSQKISLDGNINEIFSRIARSVEELIIKICKANPTPLPQKGAVVTFQRLSYADNELSQKHTINELYDRIRMVDGGGYKRAYIYFGDHKIEFSEAKIENNELLARIRIFKDGD